MNVLLLNASPKRSGGNSGYFLRLLGFLLGGTGKTTLRLSGTASYPQILAMLPQLDALVLALPVYVDGIPAHLLRFLQAAEETCAQAGCSCKVYVVANCGFFEGEQCRPAITCLQHWCRRAQLFWGGGLGLGAGEMLGALRYAPLISLALESLRFLVFFFLSLGGGALPAFAWHAPLVTLAVALLFRLRLYLSLFRLAAAIRHGAGYTTHCTGLTLCPRFVFLFFANLFWLLRALLNGVLPHRLFRRAAPPSGTSPPAATQP